MGKAYSKDMASKPKRSAKKARANPGPKPLVLKYDGNWEEAVEKALAKKKPAGGWPKPGGK
jgi:hypothetical protein